LRRHVAEEPKIIQKADPLSGSTQANESFHAVKGRYTDKHLNFTISAEARFALGVISQSRNPGWQDGLRESLDIPPLPAECSEMLRDLESNANEKMIKGKKNWKEERKTRPEMSRKEKPVGTARDRATTPSGNSMRPLQTKPKKNNYRSDWKTRHDSTMTKGFLSANIHVCCRHF
jgi:hypothetical protein